MTVAESIFSDYHTREPGAQFMAQSIQLSELTNHYPQFLCEPSDEENVLLGTSPSLPDQLRDLSRFTSEHRELLVKAIVSDLEKWDAPPEAMKAANKLGEPNSYAAVTGQQAGIVSGPLYTLYKAIGTIRVAEMFGSKYPDLQFVSVFWIEGDDHDFDEARTIHLLERSGDLRTLRYDDGDDRRRSVGDRTIDTETLGAFLNNVREILGETDFTGELLEIITSSYSEGTTLADGFARFCYSLLGDVPLVLLSSCNSALKGLASGVFTQEAENPNRLYKAIASRTAVLKERGLPTPIDPKPGALFTQHEGERISLDPGKGGYEIRGTGSRLTRNEVVVIAQQTLEKLSPNVVLRPIVQDAILPTAIYSGGPSEVAYLRQLSDAYSLFDMESPIIAPRPFVTLIEPKVERALESTELTLGSLFEESFDNASHSIDREKKGEIERHVEEGKKQIAEAFKGLEGLIEEIDKTLEKALRANAHKAEKELENLGGRLRGALKRKNGTEIKRIEGARALLLPGGSLQERTLNVLYYANRYGIESVREMFEQIELTPGAMQVITVYR